MHVLLRVQYSCGGVLVFLVLVGNSFWCYAYISVQYSCAVVSIFWLQREIVLKMRTYDRKIKISSHLSGGCTIAITTGKKSYSRLSGRCAIIVTTGKKKFQSSVWRVRDQYYFYHGSDLREIIRFLRKIECIEFECNEFVLVLVQIDLIHFEHSICISST